MRRDHFDWRSGIVTFWDLDPIDDQGPLQAQIEDLKEDLAQIEYPSGILLDVGWYPEFSKDGSFQIVVVRNGDFWSPLFRATARTFEALRTGIGQAAEFAAEAARRAR